MSGLPPQSAVRRALFGAVGTRLVPAAVGADLASLRRLGELAAADLSSLIPPSPRADAPTDELTEQVSEQPAEPRESWLDLHLQVREQLGRLPYLRLDDLAPAAEADTARLITLRYGPQDTRFPAFQFRPEGLPHDVVTTVNDLLGAEHDPWAVTCWWVGRHAW